MRIEWVNHASFVVQSGPIQLICDPWIEGTAFNNGWKLLSPTKFSYSDFSSISHIWFSHEHPDHFSPPNLRKIPEQYRRTITVLFHHTKDRRVINVCKSLGFRTEELPWEETVEIAPDFQLLCGTAGLIDSWLAIKAAGKMLLNMNDCVYDRPRELENVKSRVGKVDVLLSQFSYANWVGNPDDTATHMRHAERKRAELAKQVRLFRPTQLIPSASFVYFCHAENIFMNDQANRIRTIAQFAENTLGVETIVLYPGDVWELGNHKDSNASLVSYEADFASCQSTEPLTSPSISFNKLKETTEAFVSKCMKRNNPFLLRALPSAVVRINDLGMNVEFSYRTGLVEAAGRQPDISMSSDSLLYCVAYDWGGDTLAVNGRFQAPAGGDHRKFFRLLRVPAHNSCGNSFDFAFLGHKAIEKVRSAMAGNER